MESLRHVRERRKESNVEVELIALDDIFMEDDVSIGWVRKRMDNALDERYTP